MLTRDMTMFFQSSEEKEQANTSLVRRMNLSVDDVEGAGVRNMPWKASDSSGIVPPLINIPWLVDQPLLPSIVQALPAGLLYRSIQNYGFSDSLEVIEWIQRKKLVEIFDYALWSYDPALSVFDVDTNSFYDWLRAWISLGPTFIAERFEELEEETIVLLLSKILEIQPEGIGKIDESKEDEYFLTMDGNYHCRMKDDKDKVGFELVTQLLHAMYSYNVRWASSCFAHAAMLVRHETLDMAQKWREARLEDEGFVSKDEALGFLKYQGMDKIREMVQGAISREKEIKDYSDQKGYVETFVPHGSWLSEDPDLEESIYQLLCKTDSDISLKQLKEGLTHAEILQICGSSNVSESSIVSDDDVLEQSVAPILHKIRNLLIGTEREVSSRVYDGSKPDFIVDEVMQHIYSENPVQAGMIKSRLSRVMNMFFSAMSKEWNDDIMERIASMARGCLNLALETCLESPEKWGIQFISTSTRLEKALLVMNNLGVEFLVKMGWNLLQKLAIDSATMLVLSPMGQFFDDPSLFLDNVKGGRFAKARRMLSKKEENWESSVFHVIISIINRIPLYPVILDSETGALSAPSSRRSICTLQEYANVEGFFKNLDKLV